MLPTLGDNVTMQSFLNVTDIATGILLLLGMINGVRRGLSGELMRIILIGASIFGGWTFASTGAEWIKEHFDWSTGQSMTLSFFASIALTYAALMVIRFGLRFLMEFKFKGKVELIGGALVGLARSALLCSVVMLGLLMPEYESITRAIQASHAGTLVINHVQPHYQRLVSENPEFNFPESPQAVTESMALPESGEYLGPIIDDDGSTGGE